MNQMSFNLAAMSKLSRYRQQRNHTSTKWSINSRCNDNTASWLSSSWLVNLRSWSAHNFDTNHFHIIIIIIIIFLNNIILDPGTSFPGCETLSKVCGVSNGYNGDSEIVKVLDRQTALKRWIAAEIRWYRNVVSRGSAVLRKALLPISEINSLLQLLL